MSRANHPALDGSAPLHAAATQPTATAARVLLRHGARPGTTDARGDTALHVACAHASALVATMLREQDPALVGVANRSVRHVSFGCVCC
jgi:ankyrin repeat protein